MVRVYKSNNEKTTSEEPKIKTLKSFLDGVAGVINNYCSSSQWVSCELVRFNQNNGNYYLEISDFSENGNRMRSQTAIIFKANAFSIINKFEEKTGMIMSQGMRLLLKMRANFKAEFGFSIIVEDIDPSFTAGEMELKFKRIREELFNKGYDKLNKSKNLPFHYKRVAVLSPSNAAGLGDFKSESTRMEKYGVCSFDYYTAKFEGDGVEKSITESLKNIFDSGIKKYDALVFIRGGGSTNSLQFLNEYKILAYICRFPIPVICGIGHERDKVLIDEYARMSIDTPSKVAEFIYNTNYNNFINAEKNFSTVKFLSEKMIDNISYNVSINIDFIKSSTDALLDNYTYSSNQSISNINNFSTRVIDGFLSDLRFSYENIKSFSENHVNGLLNKMSGDFRNIVDNLNNKLVFFETETKNKYEIIDLNSHHNVLLKGYALIRGSDGSIIKSFKDEKLNDEFITIEFKDGKKQIKVGEYNG